MNGNKMATYRMEYEQLYNQTQMLQCQYNKLMEQYSLGLVNKAQAQQLKSKIKNLAATITRNQAKLATLSRNINMEAQKVQMKAMGYGRKRNVW